LNGGDPVDAEPTLNTPAADELPELLALLDACALPVADLGAGHLPGFLISRVAGRVIAVAGLQSCGEAVLLRSLAVATSHRRRGLAGRLVDALQRRAWANGQQQMFLLTTTARDFFAARGFAELPRRLVPPAIAATSEFSGICPASAVCMVKTLRGETAP